MKKNILLFCVIINLFSFNAFAQQLKEVRGVQTRKVTYTEYVNGEKITKKGYELKNENNYDVWVDMELKTLGFKDKLDDFYRTYGIDVPSGTYDKKSITLKAGETYVWKCYGSTNVQDSREGYHYNYFDNFYLEYKAYKAE